MIVLASASATRRDMLLRAGVPIETAPAMIDEAGMKESAKADRLKAGELALMLAETKASRMSARRPEALVIGADQVLDCEGEWFDKPRDVAQAGAHIHRLRGRSHRLETAVVCMRGGAVIWHHAEAPRLSMRAVSDAFIADYLASEGEALLGSVGAYRLEGLGIQLFDRIEGDFFTILGLPLLPLLGFLRQAGEIQP
ncbi:Maf family protein [Acidiphilium iwatense]|nr:Maf family protein [Acidiphilium iwatense]